MRQVERVSTKQPINSKEIINILSTLVFGPRQIKSNLLMTYAKVKIIFRAMLYSEINCSID